MRGAASCQPVTRPSTTRTGRSGPSTRSVQPCDGRTSPSTVAADSSARVTVVPTAITRPPACLCQVHQPRGARRHVERLRDRWLARLCGGNTGVQGDRRDRDTGRDQRRHQLGAERPGRACHLGAAGLPREYRLVAAQRPLPRDVGVADRSPVPGQVGRDVALDRQPRDPQPAAGDGGFGVRRQRRRVRRRRAGRCARRAGHPAGARSRWWPAAVRPPRRGRRGPSRNGPRSDCRRACRRRRRAASRSCSPPAGRRGAGARPDRRTGSARCRRVGRPAA